MTERRDPETPEEWQEAVDAAHFYLLLDSARLYGLIDGGPLVDADRCAEILKQGRERGVEPKEYPYMEAALNALGEKEK